MRYDSQRRQIQQYLTEGNSITPIEALNMFGAFRLSAIIYTLKYHYGMNIHTEMVYEEDGKRFARYSLINN